MSEDKNQNASMHNNSNSNQPQGRTDGSQNPEAEKQESGNDISRVDQQEGDMNNGESGGNFSQNDKRS